MGVSLTMQGLKVKQRGAVRQVVFVAEFVSAKSVRAKHFTAILRDLTFRAVQRNPKVQTPFGIRIPRIPRSDPRQFVKKMIQIISCFRLGRIHLQHKITQGTQIPLPHSGILASTWAKSAKKLSSHLFEFSVLRQLGLDESQFWFLPFFLAFRRGRSGILVFSLLVFRLAFHFCLPF